MLRSSRITVLSLSILSVLLLSACGDDSNDSMSPGSGASLEGTWNATSFSIDGNDQVVSGFTFTVTFTATTYSISISGDNNNVICDMTTSCTDGGAISSTGSTVTFDPGTQDEVTFSYTATATTLTLTGNIQGSAVSVSLTRS